LEDNGSRPAFHESKLELHTTGKVWLVGAGPGDPDLLTTKATKLIRAADVILHDALVSPAILALAPPSTQLVDVGKRCGRKNISQGEINRLLIEFALAGKVVLRLKGGDPMVFGRAGEELQALQEANIETEVVPGITSALAAAASAQISLTDRRFADRVVLLPAQRAESTPPDNMNTVADSRTTLAVYMPGEYGKVAEMLISTGISPDTPCVVISKISSAEQLQHFSRLTQLGEIPLQSPSLLIVGRVVECRTAAENRLLVRECDANPEI
jgi:uroporphyrin-III C-methyltransferase